MTDALATLINNILINNPSNFTSDILLYDTSEHLPIFVIRKHILMTNSSRNSSVKLKFREINLHIMDCLCSELQSRISELDYNTNNVNISLNSLEDLICQLYHRCCPIKTKTISIKQCAKPCITGKSIIMVKKEASILYI